MFSSRSMGEKPSRNRHGFTSTSMTPVLEDKLLPVEVMNLVSNGKNFIMKEAHNVATTEI